MSSVERQLLPEPLQVPEAEEIEEFFETRAPECEKRPDSATPMPRLGCSCRVGRPAWGALSCSALTPPRHARRYDLDKDEKVSFEEILQADEALRKEEEAGEGEDEEVQ